MHKNMLSIALALVLCLGALGASAADADIKKAEELMRQGKPAEAYAVLQGLENENAGNVDFDYLLGISALDSGNHERALSAFERVLAVNPAHLGARLDLARTYFALGAIELAKQEFERVRSANPPPAASKVTSDYLAAIEKHQAAQKRRVFGYLETAIGYDDNITSATAAFRGGTQQAFGAAFNPTGNAVKRRAGYATVGGGLDLGADLTDMFSVSAGFDVRGRYYNPGTAPVEPAPRPVPGDIPRDNSAYDSQTLDGRVGMSARISPTLLAGVFLRRQEFRQDGDTPINPGQERTTADRNTNAGGFDVRYALTSESQVGGFFQYANNRYPTLHTQDTDQTVIGLSYLQALQRKGNPLFYMSVFQSTDYALRPQNPPVNSTNVTRRVSGLRTYGQYSVMDNTDLMAGFGYSRREDLTAFSRSTQVPYGIDDTVEFSAGVTWRFAPLWSVRGMVQYTKNSSNLDLYSFTRTDTSVALRRELR